MLLVKTYLDRSPIHGIGVFAAEDIEQDQTVWDFLEGFDSKWSVDEYMRFPDQAKAFIMRYGFFDNGYFYADRDNSHYMNHSDNANLAEADKKQDTAGLIASTRIAAGQELTCNFLTLAHHGAYHFVPDDPYHFWDGSSVAQIIAREEFKK